jgi:hypothetical protein
MKMYSTTMPQPEKAWRGRSIHAVIQVILLLAVVTACSSAGSSKITIEERNATAIPAATYESGADFISALEKAGVPCTKNTISPITASGIHVYDSVTCIYSENDLINVDVAFPSEASRAYYSSYFPAIKNAQANTNPDRLILTGDLWYAVASTDQRLFDTQAAIGGQLIKP